MKKAVSLLVVFLAVVNIAISMYFALFRRNTSASFAFCVIAMIFVFIFSSIGKKK